MMAIISDIHGNFPALRAVMDEIERSGCEKIISLGDVAGYYCQINECIHLLRQKDVPNVMGNHDYYLAYDAALSAFERRKRFAGIPACAHRVGSYGMAQGLGAEDGVQRGVIRSRWLEGPPG